MQTQVVTSKVTSLCLVYNCVPVSWVWMNNRSFLSWKCLQPGHTWENPHLLIMQLDPGSSKNQCQFLSQQEDLLHVVSASQLISVINEYPTCISEFPKFPTADLSQTSAALSPLAFRREGKGRGNRESISHVTLSLLVFGWVWLLYFSPLSTF